MQNFAHRYPVLSPVISLASLIGVALGNALFQQMGNAGTQVGLFFSLGIAIVGLLLGIAGCIGSRGEQFLQRVPAICGVVLGSLLALGYGFVLFLLLTPNAPF